METYDFVLVGGGIVGVSTAWQLKKTHPGAGILLLEKESSLAQHQTGHNSGVIHAGVYYQPGSLKAEFCKRGAADTLAFCREHELPVEQCGKLLVATDETELQRMEALERRCVQNGIETRRISESELKKREPNIIGLGAIFVPATGITDYRAITRKMAELFVSLGGRLRTGVEVNALQESSGRVSIQAGNRRIEAKYLLVCGGLMADRLAKRMGISVDFQIVPFRGEYYRLTSRHNRIVRHLIYPIPDPELPFLGVHLTRMIDGSVTVGPNAVIGWKREGYGRVNIDIRDCAEMLTFPGFWRVVSGNFISGLSEMRDSVFKGGYLKRIHKYCPMLTLQDLKPYPAGIRAQAVKKDGSLVHDFLFAESAQSLHVCNAPSPAATSAIPIGDYLCRKMARKFSL
ncbi:MAG TPA: L-2-hydroxyglutarate oxidase [Desulfobacterales bacterium]